MGIEQLKRWHWIVIGLLAGLALGYVWSSADPVTEGRNYNQRDFERDLTRRLPDGSGPMIRHVVLRPIVTDYQGKQVQQVTLDVARMGSQSGKIYWEARQMLATIPYEPMRFGGMMPDPQQASGGKPFTVGDFLAEMNKNNDMPVKFRYGWESERPVAIAIWTVGAVVVVGGLWPTFLGLLVGAGMARKPEKKEEYDLDRFGKTSVPEAPRYQPKPEVSEEERDRLNDMNRKLEEQLKGAGVLTDGSAEDEDPEGKILAPAVRKLDGGPLETTPAAKKQDEDDEVEVKGEFYPVLIHHHKHKEEQGKEQKPAPTVPLESDQK